MAVQGPRTEFSQALKAVATERGLDSDAVIDPVTGETRIFQFSLETPTERTDITPPGFGRIAAQTAKQVIHQKIREAEKGAVMDEFSGRVGGLIAGMILRFEGPDVRVDLGRTEGIMPAGERIPSERLNISQRLTFLLMDIKD